MSIRTALKELFTKVNGTEPDGVKIEDIIRNGANGFSQSVPAIAETDEGKVLGVVDGALAWVEVSSL